MVAFNLGVLPGTNLPEAADIIMGETGDVRAIPRLPARGAGSDSVGATCLLLPDAPVEAGPRGWRLTTRPQLITRRLWDQRERDIDTLEATWGTTGFTVQLSVLGPWSLATGVELANGHRAITDPGALRDLTDILTHGILEQITRLRRRFYGSVHVQLNEPDVAALAAGSIPGTSDFDVIRPIPRKELGERLHGVFTALPECRRYLGQIGTRPLFDVARIASPDAIIVTQSAITGSELLDECAATVDTGMGLALGCVQLGDHVDDDLTQPRAHATKIAQLFDELSLDRTLIPTHVDITNAHEFHQGDLVDVGRALACARVTSEILRRDVGDL
ncbi:MAG: hypothetical protein Q4A82_06855 [Corynebacterium sp.]|nr:hypothetical protein [Corynebacterium sp.]